MKRTIKKEEKVFVPTLLSGDIGLKTTWTPLIDNKYLKKINNFSIYEFKIINHSRAEFQVRKFFFFISILFSFGLLIVPIISYSLSIIRKNMSLISAVFPILSVVPLVVFFMNIVFFFKKYNIPIIFDRAMGYYWKSKDKPNFGDFKDIKEHCFIKDIYAVQLIKGKQKSGIYEINLVLRKTGERLNVLIQGNEKRARKMGQELADFLEVPFWIGLP